MQILTSRTHLKLVVWLRKVSVARIPSRRWKRRGVSIVPHRSPVASSLSGTTTARTHCHSTRDTACWCLRHHRTSRLDARATTDRPTCPPRMGCKKAKLFAVRWRGARPSRNVSGPIIPANYVVSRRRFCPIGPGLCLLYIGGGPDPIKDNYCRLRRNAIILNDRVLDCFL